MRKLWELAGVVEDAIDSLNRAAAYALECSGGEPDTPDGPGCDGWPAMLKLCDDLTALAALADGAVSQEVRDAIKAERDEDDRLSDLADAASY